MINVEVITNSIGNHSPRLFTCRATSPKFVHQDTLRHRLVYIEDALRGDPDFSFSVSSARAIPFAKLLHEAGDPDTMAKPVVFGSEQKGMMMVEDVSRELAEERKMIWEQAAADAVYWATRMADTGAHKGIVNRMFETYIHVHALMTATTPGWMNFFGLRLDKAADPTLRALAEACWVQWNEHEPKQLLPGQWHLPLFDAEDEAELRYQHRYLGRDNSEEFDEEAILRDSLKVSTGRCARLSYESFETGKRSTADENIKLHDRLVGFSPIHASPAEHQAQVDELLDVNVTIDIPNEAQRAERLISGQMVLRWAHPELSGNLGPGWIQYRKTIPGEALAPLPEGYR